MSLVEVLLATALLGGAVLTTAQVMASGARGRYDARLRSLATHAVEQRLERLGAAGAEALPACPPPESCLQGDDFAPEKGSVGGYDCSAAISEVHFDGDAALGPLRVDTAVWPHPDGEQRTEGQMITVSACWRGGGGRLYELSLRRLVLSRGGGG